MRPRPKFPLLLLGALLAGSAVVALVRATDRAASVTAAAGRTPVRVTSKLPRWLAPGGELVVAGWAGAEVELRLRAGDRPLGRVQSGPLGRFRFRVRAPSGGRHMLWLETDEQAVRLGRVRVRPVIVAAVGDVTFGSGVLDAVRSYGPRYPWRGVARTLRGADVATGNLETAVSTRGVPAPGKEFTFRGPPSALAAAAWYAGIDVFSLANNHSLDYGVSAFLDTLAYARRFGVATVGGGKTLAAARRPAIVRRGGVRLAFLGYSDVRPPGFDAGPSTPGAAPADTVLIDTDVRRARRHADVVIVWFHWGQELATSPDYRQRQFAGAALNAGASVVLGAHPHVLQPVVRPDRRRVVAWSLGNFVFPAHSPNTERTGILLLALDARGVRRHYLRPARIHGVQPRLT